MTTCPVCSGAWHPMLPCPPGDETMADTRKYPMYPAAEQEQAHQDRVKYDKARTEVGRFECVTCASYKVTWPLSPSGLSRRLVQTLTPAPCTAKQAEFHKSRGHDVRPVREEGVSE